jgi:hypothetical protein
MLFCANAIYSELAREGRYRRMFGESWQVNYEKDFDSLATLRARMVVAAVGIVVLCSLVIWLFRILRPNRDSHRKTRKGRSSSNHRHTSPIERIVRYRRNALLGVYFGIAGIVSGVFLVLFRVGIFADHSNELVLGIAVFCCGYCGVLAGCSWWLKAKGWNEAIVVIALMPLGIILIPFVRLVLFSAPLLMPACMVMMPLILIVVVLTLPDQSGIPRQRPQWERDYLARRPEKSEPKDK